MKHTIQIITLIAALMMSGVGEAWAFTADDIVFQPDPVAGGTCVPVLGEHTTDGQKVTVTITPAEGYFLKKQDLVVQRLVSPSAAAPRRATVNIADTLKVEGPQSNGNTTSGAQYTFTVPDGYAGALVTAKFTVKSAVSVNVKANELVYNQAAQELVSVTIEGGSLQYQVDATADNGFTEGIPKKTAVKRTGTNAVTSYKVYYKVVPDEFHAATTFDVTKDFVEVTIKPALLTRVTLSTTAQKYDNGQNITFGVSKVYAANLEVPSAEYDVADNVQSAVGSYKAKVTAKANSNYTGSVTATFHIVANTVKLVSSSTEASEINALDGTYILTSNVEATVFANLYATDKIFTGTLDGDMYTISKVTHALFNKINGGTVKNVMLDGVNITEGTNVGAIANEMIGTSAKKACIYNCGILSGSVKGTAKVGGLVGVLGQVGTANADKNNCYARVINCFSYADIKGGADKGGIVGYNCYATTSKSNDLRSMVMNCMFYGDIVEGNNIAPIYGGTNISNKDANGVSNYNYFRAEASYVQNNKINVYNCALMAETRFLQRFEFFRHILNGHRELAAWWATDDRANKDQMMKWVMIPDSIGTKHPYPILMRPGKYPSVVNYDAEHATFGIPRNQGGKLGELTVNIQMGSGGAVFGPPSTASITTNRLTLNITDKDTLHYNFNYYKVQLPYYNDVGTGNYTFGSDGGDKTSSRVVTGWKIVEIEGGTPGTTFAKTGADVTYDDKGNIVTMPFNFADRHCTKKDLYSESGRVFNQGAYWDVPEGVTEITIEPYWAKAVYLADANADVVYNTAMTAANLVPNVGGGTLYTNGGENQFNGQKVYTSLTGTGGAIASDVLGANASHTVYDYAVVLVGNYHHYHDNTIEDGNKPYTVTSVDLDGDNEPDYSFILRFNGRKTFHPVRYDFLNLMGLGMAQKSTGGTGSYNFGIMQPKYWFEATNTSLFRVTQFEYDRSDRSEAPYIVQGGVMEQWVSGQNNGASNNTTYFHVGGNVWFKEFHRGTHQDKQLQSKHPPVSVTGGDYDEFYLTGLYTANVTSYGDNAECYINGGRFGTVCGAAMEGIGKAKGADNTGNITWQIQNADIDEFYAGGINAANGKIVEGSITTVVEGGYIKLFCGGPKFGDMNSGKTVTTTAKGTIFDTFFGAGYGGNAYSRQAPRNHNNVVNFPHQDKEAGNDDSWNAWLSRFYKKEYNTTYGGVSTQYSYQFLPMSGNADNVARIFVDYVKFSLAKTKYVTSNLTDCTIKGNFYGGGSLGKVEGPATSTLKGCTVEGSVFGAGFSAFLPTVAVDSIGFKVEPYYYTALGSYRKGVKRGTTNYTWKQAKTVNNNATAVDNDKHILYTTEDLNALGTVTGKVTLNIEEGTTVLGDVFGGGESSDAKDSVVVNIKGGTLKDVYGGGSAAHVDKLAVVNLTGGTINGDVYGGGKGRFAVAAVGTEGQAGYKPAVTEVKARVGKTLVNLNGTKKTEEDGTITYPDKCIVNGRIFGCNNLNGSPLDSATVHIYKTWGTARTPKEKLDHIDDKEHTYHLQAVYGGGNLAAFEPTDMTTASKATTHVIIDGCDMTSIRQVYGGGNAASTPATFVEVNGTYEIEEVFGGGNGKDPIGVGKPNPGANVGYKDYAQRDDNGVVVVDEDGVVQEKDNANTVEERQNADNGYLYGSGEANVRIYGGKIHRVFGGSNTLGNVRNIALTLLDGQEECDFSVDEAYGGGKSAPMDGAAKLEMACIPGLKAAYGGAEEAEIHNDVTLNITNGTFDRVFGGNNVQGTIDGNITVNIEETGCRPIIIGQLFGGGNQAPYGNTGGSGKVELNVRSFTSIGDIYGGGYGKTATVTGDTYLNINVCNGAFVNQDTDDDLTGQKTITFKEFQRNENGTFVYAEEDTKHTTRLTVVPDPIINVNLPPHAAGEIGAIHNVYGGGWAAKVIGNTHVSIGTEQYVPINTVSAGDDLSNVEYYTRTGEGTSESPYVYTKATTVEDGKTYYALVKGANIIGNVYGGGNEADVTGRTNVTIGKKKEGE